MRPSRWHAVTAAAALAGLVLAGQGSSAATTPLTLGAIVRVTTPGTSLCPAEGEPETTVTPLGIWVAYNDDHQCPLVPGMTRIEEVQLIRAQGPAAFVPLTPASGEIISGDPDLAPAGDGGVYLSALWQAADGSLGVKVLRISPTLKVTILPTPSRHGSSNSDDKEFIAVDQAKRSPWHGRLYVAWDDFTTGSTVLRSWNGHAWSPTVTLVADGGGDAPDVAVGPTGVVAAAFTGQAGAVVRLSHDGGRTFGAPIVALPGAAPGRTDPSCPLRPTIGLRQRALMGARVAFDRAGDVHVVAAMGDFIALSTAPNPVTGEPAVVRHAVIHAGRVVHSESVTAPTSDEQWAGSLAALPKGGIAVSWLQTNGAAFSTYDAWVAVQKPGARTFTAPQRLSPASSNFPAATEAVGNSNCYGIGDYIGMATTAKGVETVWPTTDTDTPGVDSDVLVRVATVR